MDYKELNDNELVYLCAEHNEEANNLLVNKYKNCIIQIIKDYMKEYNVLGIEINDLYQEGLIGLLHAISTFDPKRDVLFYTYANACIKTSIFSAIRKTFGKKTRILNNSYSLDKLYNNGETTLYEMFKDESFEPNKLLLNEEEEKELVNTIRSKLSKNELNIFNLKLSGLSNTEISKLIDKDKKYVENTIFRISKKYKELI